MGWCLGREH